MLFKDRVDAGKKLSSYLSEFQNNDDVVIFGIPRGGMVVAKTIADQINAKFDVVMAKKIGAPFNNEVAIAAVDINGDVILIDEYIDLFNVKPEYIEHQKNKVLKILKDQIIKYRGSVVYNNLQNKTAIIVDDGIATGATVRSCISFLKKFSLSHIYVATPVISPSALKEIKGLCDNVYYILSEEPFYAVGQFYIDFSDVDDGFLNEIIKS